MNHQDIEGTKAKSFYKGVAREVLNMRDIDGNAPKYEQVIKIVFSLHFYS